MRPRRVPPISDASPPRTEFLRARCRSWQRRRCWPAPALAAGDTPADFARDTAAALQGPLARSADGQRRQHVDAHEAVDADLGLVFVETTGGAGSADERHVVAYAGR